MKRVRLAASEQEQISEPLSEDHTKMAGNFRQVGKCLAHGVINIVKYASLRSGLKVVIADVPGPIVNAYLCLVTETLTDDGLPHTLEHLCFMGSKQYPYKGLLDMLANGCLASGTNAWTAQDHTAYTISTAGQQGLLKLLPIYLDHILQPLLTESHFLTEVHHVTGEGNDAGVVYTEMQEHESKLSTMVDLTLRANLFAGTGYAVETGGRLHPLRTSCSIHKVRDYHRQYYSTSNLCVIVSGQIDHEALLSTVHAVECSMLAARGDDGTPPTDSCDSRPFSAKILPLSASKEFRIRCPSDDDSMGEVVVGWHGPTPDNQEEISALMVLSDYLEDTAVAPLQRDFVQINDPLCSDVDVTVEEQSVCLLSMTFSGVPMEKLSLVKDRLLLLMKSIVNGQEPMDMERMQCVIDQKIFRCRNRMETMPQMAISDLAIADAIYGDNSVSPLARHYNYVPLFQKLKHQDSQFWRELVRRYFDEANHIAVLGEADADMVDEESAKEDNRIAKQKKGLGENGLKKKAEELTRAVAENTNEVPASLFDTYVINSLKDVQFIDVREYSSLDGAKQHPMFSLQQLPYEAMLYDARTNFVQLSAILDTSRVPLELRPYLMIWQELLFESPMMPDDSTNGEFVPHDVVIKQFSRDLVEYLTAVGIKSGFQRFVTILLTVPSSRFSEGTLWLRRFLTNVQFKADRIKVVATKLANSGAEMKQEGEDMSYFLLEHMTFEANSNPYALNVVRLVKFFRKVAKRCTSEPKKVEEALNSLRQMITAPECLTVKLLCDVNLVTSDADATASEIWANNFTKSLASPTTLRLTFDREPTYVRRNSFGQGIICSIGACESCHLYQVCASLDDWRRSAPLTVFLQYLTQSEGPLWRNIRGAGLAYDASVSLNVDTGLLVLNLYRSSQLALAYSEAKRTIENVLCDPVNEREFLAAQRSLVFELVKQEETVEKTASLMMVNRLRKLPPDFNRKFCEEVFAVTPDACWRMAKEYMPLLFNPKTTNTSVVCHPTKRKAIINEFRQFGKELRLIKLDDSELSFP